MSALFETQVKTFPQFMTAISKRLSSNAGPVWFRGCGDSARHSLKPSLFRHPTKATLTAIRDMEQESMALFKQRSVPYRTAAVNELSWEQLFVMQHYGVPTRLLDWTESPFAALFFALTSVPRDQNGAYTATAAAVWVLEPDKWNEYALRNVGGKPAILAIDSLELKSYEPMTDSPRSWSDEPVALFGIYNSPRIVAQRGVFTIAGSSLSGMEDIFSRTPYPASALAKLVIPISAVDNLLSDLVRIGNSDSVFFPDLDGLAREIRRRLGFSV